MINEQASNIGPLSALVLALGNPDAGPNDDPEDDPLLDQARLADDPYSERRHAAWNTFLVTSSLTERLKRFIDNHVPLKSLLDETAKVIKLEVSVPTAILMDLNEPTLRDVLIDSYFSAAHRMLIERMRLGDGPDKFQILVDLSKEVDSDKTAKLASTLDDCVVASRELYAAITALDAGNSKEAVAALRRYKRYERSVCPPKWRASFEALAPVIQKYLVTTRARRVLREALAENEETATTADTTEKKQRVYEAARRVREALPDGRRILDNDEIAGTELQSRAQSVDQMASRVRSVADRVTAVLKPSPWVLIDFHGKEYLGERLNMGKVWATQFFRNLSVALLILPAPVLLALVFTSGTQNIGIILAIAIGGLLCGIPIFVYTHRRLRGQYMQYALDELDEVVELSRFSGQFQAWAVR